MPQGTSADLTCTVTGITQAVTAVFEDTDGPISTVADVTTVTPGDYAADADFTQKFTLTIVNPTEDKTYTCKVTSGQYTSSGAQSAEVELSVFSKYTKF